MNGFDLLHAMENIDDRYIEEANKNIEEKHTRVFHWKALVNIAALFVICVITAVAIKTLPMSKNANDAAPPVYEEILEDTCVSVTSEKDMGAPETFLEDAGIIEEDSEKKLAVESAKADYPALIRVNGVIYCDSNEIVTVAKCGVMDGEITSQCDGVPTLDNQSNFGTGYGYQFWEDRIGVLIDGEWHIFVPY